MINKKEQNNVNNLIGSETILEGNISTAGNLRIDGKIVGNIQSKSKVVLGEHGIIEGDIHGGSVEIGGRLKGTIHVTELLLLKSTSNVQGDVFTQKLVLEEGAQFNGKCNMESELPKPK